MLSEMCILDPTGHSRQTWDAAVPVEVEAARSMFNSLRKKGYVAYHVKKDGEPGEVMTDFDPEAGKVIMSPPLAGG